MKSFSTRFLAVQRALFKLLSVIVFLYFLDVFGAGGAFDSMFYSVQFWRLVDFLAPYLALPVSIVLTSALIKKENYKAAVLFPVLLVAFAFLAGRAHLKTIPDPIADNFGALPAPYAGFLVLPPEAVPIGFKEVEHHYTKREYTISFTKMVDGKRIGLDIAEGDRIIYPHNGSKLLQELEYQGITGQVYTNTHSKTREVSLSLEWLNPPKQRIAIFLTQTPKKDYSPEDLIKILKSMK